LKVAILLGGDSPERDVSLETGRCVAKALRELGHEIFSLDTARGGDPLPEDLESWGSGPSAEPPKLPLGGSRDRSQVFSAVQACGELKVQVIFNALHGGIGEDGTIQGYLDLMGIPYTGSGMLACALAMDKTMAKKIFRQMKIRTPRGVTLFLKEETSFSELKERLIPNLSFPLVVKPNNQGSTIGLSLVRGEEQLPAALQEAGRYGGGILVEEYIPGRELAVAILEERALPIVEILPRGGLYDYTCKYTDGQSQYLTNVALPPKLVREVQSMSLAAFRALGCYGYSRADLRLSPENVPYLLEINTLPGMTSHSLVPKAALAEGIAFPQLVEKILALALDRRTT
jgi:D-alanine-D-alanine ligase